MKGQKHEEKYQCDLSTISQPGCTFPAHGI